MAITLEKRAAYLLSQDDVRADMIASEYADAVKECTENLKKHQREKRKLVLLLTRQKWLELKQNP